MIRREQCVKRLIATLTENYNEEAPFIFSKLDTKDGFWRLAVSHTGAWKFFCVIQKFRDVKNIRDIKVGVPTFLQMG